MAQASTPSTPAAGTPAKKTTTRRTATKRATTTRRSTASARATTPAKTAKSTPNGPLSVVGEYAERAVLIQVGAALTARDAVVSGVNDVFSPTKAQTQLKKFERRGTTARKGLERDVRKTRTRIERELRQRRRRLERTVNSFDASQLENAVQARLRDGSDLASRLQDRLVRRP